MDEESRKEKFEETEVFIMKNISLEIVCSMDKIYSRLDIAEKT